MEFGGTIQNPLLKTAFAIGEATIRQACGTAPGLRIHAELDRLQDGREGLRITLHAPGSLSAFTMVLRKYFDREALMRVAQRAWVRRVPCAQQRFLASLVPDPSNN